VPSFTLVAGPNGSGKSTLTAAISFDGAAGVVDPDAIAAGLDPARPSRVAFAAARQAILRSRRFLDRRESFVLESTLAGHGALSLMREARKAGYRTLVVYVALGDPELHIERVRLRVTQGGHDIPDADIRRRYTRSLRHAPEAMRLGDEAIVLDNSGPRPERMLLLQAGRMVWRAESLPAWVLHLAEEFD
jgi:predicted ABC-type ATPase